MSRFEAPRGTQDVTPAEWPAWQRVLDVGADLFARYGYRRIQTPVFEDTELFARTAGVGSDVVQKEMYTFSDRAERSLTLRPEGTAPICRAYLEHGMREPQPVKLYAVASMYRYAAPRQGRYREHWQFSVEAIGSRTPVDAELIQLYAELLRARRRGVPAAAELDRRPRVSAAYVERLEAWLDEHADELDDEAREKRATSPLRVFDVKNERTRALLADAPTIGESLCDACREHFASVRQYLDAYGVRYELDPRSCGARLLHANDVRVHPRDARPRGRRRRALRLPRRGARRAVDAGDRLPGRNRAPRPHPSGSRHRSGAARAGPLLPRRSRRRPRCRSCRDDAARAAGLACDTDYAGRSPKGQRTQLARSGRAASSTCAPTA